MIDQTLLSLLASIDAYRKAPGSFLFSLVNPSGLPPTKMPLKVGREEYAIYCGLRYGPTFGFSPRTNWSNSDHDLEISNLPTSQECSSRLNGSYQCPNGQDTARFLTGEEFFTVSEIEVFGFE